MATTLNKLYDFMHYYEDLITEGHIFVRFPQQAHLVVDKDGCVMCHIMPGIVEFLFHADDMPPQVL